MTPQQMALWARVLATGCGRCAYFVRGSGCKRSVYAECRASRPLGQAVYFSARKVAA